MWPVQGRGVFVVLEYLENGDVFGFLELEMLGHQGMQQYFTFPPSYSFSVFRPFAFLCPLFVLASCLGLTLEVNVCQQLCFHLESMKATLSWPQTSSCSSYFMSFKVVGFCGS